MSTQGDPPSQDYMAVARSPSSPWPGGICFRPEGPLAVDREAEEALRSASLLACNSGMTVEILNLKKDCVVIRRHPDEDGKCGDLVYHVWAEAAGGKRVLKVNEESKQVLERLVAESRCWRVFSQPRAADRNGSPGCSSPQWDVSERSLRVIRLCSIRVPDYMRFATRF